MTQAAVKAIVFDIGRVLLDWDPRYLYRKLFKEEQDAEYFLENVCTLEWIARLDKGAKWEVAIADLVEKFPAYKTQIIACHQRWNETIPDALWDTVDIMNNLRTQGFPIYCITNFGYEGFQREAQRFPFLNEFDGIVISGEIGIAKPDPEIFHTFLDKYNLNAGELLFIDDREENIQAAKSLGFKGIIFEKAEQLKTDLVKMGIPV